MKILQKTTILTKEKIKINHKNKISAKSYKISNDCNFANSLGTVPLTSLLPNMLFMNVKMQQIDVRKLDDNVNEFALLIIKRSHSHVELGILFAEVFSFAVKVISDVWSDESNDSNVVVGGNVLTIGADCIVVVVVVVKDDDEDTVAHCWRGCGNWGHCAGGAVRQNPEWHSSCW